MSPEFKSQLVLVYVDHQRDAYVLAVEFLPKVPPTLESTQLSKDLREGGVNLKLKKTPKLRGNKHKMPWNIQGPADSMPRPANIMGPPYGSMNGFTGCTKIGRASCRERVCNGV